MVRSVKDWEPSVSYQATVSPPTDAETASTSHCRRSAGEVSVHVRPMQESVVSTDATMTMSSRAGMRSSSASRLRTPATPLSVAARSKPWSAVVTLTCAEAPSVYAKGVSTP